MRPEGDGTAATGVPLIAIRGLSVELRMRKRTVHPVNDVSLTLERDETLGLVGESGSGKTMMSLAIMGLLPQPFGRIVAGEIAVRRGGPRDPLRLRAPPDPGRPHLDGLPGADDLARPAVHDRLADRRGDQRAPRHRVAQAATELAVSMLERVTSPPPASGLELPARALRGHAPARDDRDGTLPASPSCCWPTSRRQRST